MSNKNDYRYLVRNPVIGENLEKIRTKWLNSKLPHVEAAVKFTAFLEERDCITIDLTHMIILQYRESYPDFGIDVLKDVIGIRMGYSGWKGLNKRVYCQESANNARLSLAERRRKLAPKREVKDFTHYFFWMNRSYLEQIVATIDTYDDMFLERAKENSDNRLDEDDFYRSFGIFFRRIIALKIDTDVDLNLIKRLARMLYVWHNRRYIKSHIVARNCRSLPKRYRIETYGTAFTGKLSPEDDFEEIDQNE